MALLKYDEWLKQQNESSASTRRRRATALGLMPLAGMGSLHGHSTASDWEVKSIKKQTKKKHKKHKS